MRHARRLRRTRALYHPYVERRAGAGKGLLEALAERAAVVVTDDYPGFFLPRMVAAAGERLPVRLEKVDSNGLLPLAAGLVLGAAITSLLLPGARDAVDRLLADRDVDMILALGVIASHEACQRRDLPKPVIAPSAPRIISSGR